MKNNHILIELDKLKGPLFVVMIGPPGCGKSTLSSLIPGTVISMEIPIDIRYKTKETQLRYKMLEGMLAHKNIIIDRICMTKKARAQQLKQKPYGYTPVAVNLHNVSIVNLIERMSIRPEAHRRIPMEALHKMFKEFEPPSLDEGFTSILTRTEYD